MNYPINLKDISDKLEYYDEVIEAHKEASDFILSFYWCFEVKNSSIYTNLGKLLCIFLFEIDNSASEDDNFLWVIVGDLPPMYLDTLGPTTTVQVLEDYADLAQDWIDKVKIGKSVNDCYPFIAAATLEMAELFQVRINLIKHNLIPNIEEISIQTL